MGVGYRKSFPKTCAPGFVDQHSSSLRRVFLACRAGQINAAGPQERRHSRHTLLKGKAPPRLATCEQPPFSHQVGEEHGVYAGGRRGERLQGGMGKVLCSWCQPSPFPHPPPRHRRGHLRWGRMEMWPQSAGLQEGNSWREHSWAAAVF